MSDVVTISSRLTNLEVSPQFDSYSKVIIHVSDETAYVAGDDVGRTLEIDNPFGTQAMANAMLASLRGFQYQPYQADGALLDPAAEIGDAANMRGNYGGIYTRDRTFGRLMKADISAPCDEEINHEYTYESPETREFKRSINDVKASLIIANDRIDAKVSQTGGNASSFGWSMDSSSHRWYANGQEVMSITASGLTVRGNIQTDTGNIGGFTISASAIYNNIPYLGAPQSSGVYIGTDGIQLGSNFVVDRFGTVSANSMYLAGVLNLGGVQITPQDLANRANSAYNWTDNYGAYSYSGAGYGYSYNRATTVGSGSYPSYFRAGQLSQGGYGFVRGTPFVYNGITHYPWEYQA